MWFISKHPSLCFLMGAKMNPRPTYTGETRVD